MTLPTVKVNGAYTRQLHPLSCSIKLSLQPLSTVNMVLPPTDEISVLDWVKVPAPDGTVGYYRVASVSTDADTGEKTVYAEHGACTLGDEIVSGDVEKTDVWADILGYVVAQQSTQVWQIGEIEVDRSSGPGHMMDASDTVYIDLGEHSLMDNITTLMQSIPGYYAEYEQRTDSDWYINIRSRQVTAACEARLSRNLKSCSIAYDASKICTRVYVEGLSSGKIDSPFISFYGVREETKSLNKKLSAGQKYMIATAYLWQHDHPQISVSISGIELSQITGLTVDRFAIGSICTVAIPWMEVTAAEMVIEKTYSDAYNAPEAVTLTLANNAPDLSIAIASLSGGGGGGGGGRMTDLEKDRKRFETHFEQTDEYFSLLATETEWDELGNGTVTAYGKIVVNSSSITSEVARATAAEGTLSTQIQQNADSIALKVSKGDVSSQLAVECGNVSISGANLVVSGYVTASAFDGLQASFNNLVSGTTRAASIKTNQLSASSSFTLGGAAHHNSTITIDGVNFNIVTWS